MFYSIITFLVICSLSIVTLFKVLPIWVTNSDKKINWGLIMGYSILFGLFGGISVLILHLQYKFKRRKHLELYQINI